MEYYGNNAVDVLLHTLSIDKIPQSSINVSLSFSFHVPLIRRE